MFEYLKSNYKYAEIEMPLSQDVINKISKDCFLKFGVYIPKEYHLFLQELNGFYYNGYAIFGCYDSEMIEKDKGLAGLDLVSFNERFRDFSEIEDLLIIGKSSIDYIAYELATNQYVIVTNGTLDEIYRSSSFLAILSNYLEDL